jgi:hypothetical protein
VQRDIVHSLCAAGYSEGVHDMILLACLPVKSDVERFFEYDFMADHFTCLRAVTRSNENLLKPFLKINNELQQVKNPEFTSVIS